MASVGPETKLVRKMVTKARKRGDANGGDLVITKIHGGPHGVAGEPDLDVVYRGVPIKIEVKVPPNSPTRIQLHRLALYAKAGAVAAWVDDVDQFLQILDLVEDAPTLTMLRPVLTSPPLVAPLDEDTKTPLHHLAELWPAGLWWETRP